MEELVIKPGDIVVTNYSAYQHWSIVSDRVCAEGKPMLISATKRTGTVQEEPWDIVTNGKKTYVADVTPSKSIPQLLTDARSQIGSWPYSVTSKNCEHFVKWASNLQVTSSQVKAGVGGAMAGVAMVKLLSDHPKMINFLGGALLVGGLAVVTTKAVEKHTSNSA